MVVIEILINVVLAQFAERQGGEKCLLKTIP